MSISVKHATKVFNGQAALNDVSLEVPSGQVLGLLGPNGAGKSTLMRLISGYIPPTSGHLGVSGYDVDTSPLETKKRIGYLPEHNPLPEEMFIREYLQFVGGLYELQNIKAKVDGVMNVVGLMPEANKKIGQLSKGFRQRVGIAAAIIHEPEVLILDEPTSGLDPNQLVEIRSLIKSIGEKRTVMLSTHVMQEVEAMCDRVVMIRKGEIVADESTSVFTNRDGGLEAAFKELTA
ncbi:MAG TPA: ATP-binding cassette domain-containing protein [Flavobacteriales bacterium]|jgi:ABC-2 type transport system ATP-binding protein|nr:ATP-binding cassette domain-containing protein [Flavobacteriales bacterium]HIN41527.1 ATP-binding cassette domain-containing protein [Flavobacteriales bacterium]